MQPSQTNHLPGVTATAAAAAGAAADGHVGGPGGAGMQMQRSKTAPSTPVKVAGFRTGEFGMTSGQVAVEKRHFDPSREPKLLGLL